LSTGKLALDIIGNHETLTTDRLDVVVRGLELANAECSVGTFGSTGGCTLERDGDSYRATFTPLKPGQGITIGGTITGRLPITESADPPLPKRRRDERMKVALATIPLGVLGAGAAFYAARRAGRNEVFAGGAADAAYGTSPSPSGDGQPRADVRLVPDSKMDDLATIEFVPPKGIEPWQGSVLLNERIDRTTVAAWVSGRVAKDELSLRQEDGGLVLSRGKQYADLKSDDKAIVDQLLDYGDELALGEYNANFGQAWGAILAIERESIADSGWWTRLPPSGAGSGGSAGRLVLIAIFALVFFGAGSLITALLGAFRGIALALVFAIAVPAIVAHFVYRVLSPARSATGSALALRAESFRRFLAASEGQHVDWAWKQGLLREYSAWAVALGAADAWGRALADSNVPAPEMYLASPIWLYSMGPSFESTRSAPAPSGGSGGGGFGGFSGGGGSFGGGGAGGSW